MKNIRNKISNYKIYRKNLQKIFVEKIQDSKTKMKIKIQLIY